MTCEEELERLKAKFNKLDQPKYSGAPMLDHVLGTPNQEFRAWVATMPSDYWARYDLSAVRIGWEGHANYYRKNEDGAIPV